MGALGLIKKYAEHNPVLILAGVIVIVALGGVFLWHENQKQTYYASRQEACAQLAENQIAEMQKNDAANSTDAVERIPTGFYVYARTIDDCVFESVEETVNNYHGASSKATVDYDFELSGLFSGHIIALADTTTATTTAIENKFLEPACGNFNIVLAKYFDVYDGDGISCVW